MMQPRACRRWPCSQSIFLQHENYRTIHYTTPEYDQSDVIVPGSDDELGHDERKAKRRRIVSLSKSYLSGNALFVSSAALRGPFGRSHSTQVDKVSPRHATKTTRHVEFVPRRQADETLADMDHSPFVATPTPVSAQSSNHSRKRPVRSMSAVVLPRSIHPSLASPIVGLDQPKPRHDSPRPCPVPEAELEPICELAHEPMHERISELIHRSTVEPIHEPVTKPIENSIHGQDHAIDHKRPHDTQHAASTPAALHRLPDAASISVASHLGPEPADDQPCDIFQVDVSDDEPRNAKSNAVTLSKSPLPAVSGHDDSIGIQHAKALSQRALQNQLDVAERRRSGKLPSLNKFTPAKRRDVDTSPFTFRRVGARSTKAAQNAELQPRGTPWANTQAMLEEAHSALIHTIRRNAQPVEMMGLRQSLPTTRAPSPITPFAAFNRGLSPVNDTDRHPKLTQAINTQAMFDAYSPFSLSTSPKAHRRIGSLLSKDKSASAGLKPVDVTEDVFVKDVDAESTSHPVYGGPERDRPTLSVEVAEAVAMAEPDNDHDVSMEDAADDEAVASHDDASLSRPFDHTSRSRRSSNEALAYTHHSSANPYSANSGSTPKQTNTLLVPASTARPSVATDSSGIQPGSRAMTTSFSNAQRSPSIDIDVSLNDLQETVLGSWDVHEAMRRGVEAA